METNALTQKCFKLKRSGFLVNNFHKRAVSTHGQPLCNSQLSHSFSHQLGCLYGNNFLLNNTHPNGFIFPCKRHQGQRHFLRICRVIAKRLWEPGPHFSTKSPEKMGNFKLEINNFPQICDKKIRSFGLAPLPFGKKNPSSAALWRILIWNK